ncbi:T9SS type A sorting domain-containing protein [Aequorivita sinensis]|uniref:T9SS type A sorting domain-containing protein n=1 Tax=Aequorivita sinensis TaxID=1382458 RepID=UPI00111EE067|nr:T9SS type A sorting domain-containing protein [Aequorivita sinensis]
MKKILLFLVLLTYALMGAQDGALDTSFGDDGTIQTDINGDSDFAISITQQADEKILVAGQFKIQGEVFPSIARFNLDGYLDNSFGSNGVVLFNRQNYEDEYYNKVLSQSDGKIVAGGIFSLTSSDQLVVNKFLADGSFDIDFGNNGELIIFSENTGYGDFALLNDNSILAAGSLFENGISKIGLKKYLPNGTLDTSFGNNGVAITAVGNQSNIAKKLVLTPDYKIIVLANCNHDGESLDVLLRYLPNGSLDSSFGDNGVLIITIDSEYSSKNIAVYEDGKIVVQSSYFNWQNEIQHNLISRYLADGGTDTSFGSGGFINPNNPQLGINKIEVQQNQRLLIFGGLNNPVEGGGKFYMRRYHIDGTADSSFNFVTYSSDNAVADMVIQQDGKITCLASTIWYNGQEDIVMERHMNNPLSIPEFDTNTIAIYPNPSNGIFTIDRGLLSEKTPFQITDITGKIIATGQLNEKQTQLDLSSAQSGVYFLKTSNSGYRLLKN